MIAVLRCNPQISPSCSYVPLKFSSKILPCFLQGNKTLPFYCNTAFLAFQVQTWHSLNSPPFSSCFSSCPQYKLIFFSYLSDRFLESWLMLQFDPLVVMVYLLVKMFWTGTTHRRPWLWPKLVFELGTFLLPWKISNFLLWVLRISLPQLSIFKAGCCSLLAYPSRVTLEKWFSLHRTGGLAEIYTMDVLPGTTLYFIRPQPAQEDPDLDPLVATELGSSAKCLAQGLIVHSLNQTLNYQLSHPTTRVFLDKGRKIFNFDTRHQGIPRQLHAQSWSTSTLWHQICT